MRPKKLKTTLIAFLILLFLCTALVLLLNTLVHNPSVQRYLLGQLSETTGYHHSAGDLKLSFRNGFGFSAQDVVAESQESSQRIKASRLRVALDFSELIKGRIVPSRIFVFRPRIEMAIVKGDGPPKVGDVSVFGEMIIASLSHLRSGSVKQGRLLLKGFPFELEDLDLEVYPPKKHPGKIQVNMRGKAVSKEDSAQFILQGTIAADKQPAGNPTAEMTIKTGKFPLSWIPWPKSLPFSTGVGEADISLKAVLGEAMTAEGKITAGDVRFSFVRRGQTKDYCFDRLQADFATLYSKNIFEVSSFQLKDPDFSLSATFKIDSEDNSAPHFTLKVESPFLPLATFKEIFPTPFVPPWVNEKIIPNLSGGHARLVLFSLNGTRDQIKQLRLPENRDAMSLKIELNETNALRDGGALPFEKVSGELNIEKGALSTSIRQAVFGNSTISNASLNVSSLYGPRTYCVSEQGLFDLQDLKQLENLDIMPSGGRKFLQEFENLSGKLEGSIQVGFDQGWVNPRILSGKFRFRDCSVTHKGLYLPLSLHEADLQINGQGEPRFLGAGRWGRSEFQVSGSADSQWKVKMAQIASKVHINEILDRFYPRFQLSLSQKDLVPIKATVTGKQDTWSFQGETNLDDVALASDSISVCPLERCKKAVFDITLLPGEKIRLNRLEYRLGETALELTGAYDLTNQDIMQVNVSSEKIVLEDLGIRFKNENGPTKGIVSCELEIQASLKDLLKTSVAGVAIGKNISLDLDGMVSPIKDCGFNLDFSEKDILIRSLNMRVGDESLLDIYGQLQGWDGLKGEITANADYLNLSEFIPEKTGSEEKLSAQNSFRERSDIGLVLNARRGRWKKVAFGPLQSELGFRSGDFHIKHAEAQTPHGSLSARGHVKGKKGPDKIFFTSDIRLKNQPIEDLEESLGFKRDIEGRLTMAATLSVKGGEAKDLIPGLTGSAEIILSEATIKRKRGIVFKVLEFLSLKNIIRLKMPDLSQKGFEFESLEAHADINEGILETDTLIFKSRVFNATAQGAACLPTKTVDLKLWVQTLESMDFVVRNIPIIGYILTEKEKSPKGVLIYPLKVEGRWTDPKIESSVLNNLAPGVINIFKRILLTPGRIFKGISEITSSIVNVNGSQAEERAECDKTIKMQ